MQNMTTGSTTKPIVLLGILLSLGDLLWQVYSRVDTVVVGRFVSSLPILCSTGKKQAAPLQHRLPQEAVPQW